MRCESHGPFSHLSTSVRHKYEPYLKLHDPQIGRYTVRTCSGHPIRGWFLALVNAFPS